MAVDKLEMQTFQLDFINQDTFNVSYTFTNAPFVTATSDQDVNVYVESVTNNGCVVRSSSPITGVIFLSVIGNL